MVPCVAHHDPAHVAYAALGSTTFPIKRADSLQPVRATNCLTVLDRVPSGNKNSVLSGHRGGVPLAMTRDQDPVNNRKRRTPHGSPAESS